jgi:hypothetical protein
VELLRRLNDLGIDDCRRRYRAARVDADFRKRAVQDILESNQTTEQPLIKTVAVLVVCGDNSHNVTEQVQPSQARVGARGPKLVLLVEFRCRHAERGSLKIETGFVAALVVDEPKIGGSLQPSGGGDHERCFALGTPSKSTVERRRVLP